MDYAKESLKLHEKHRGKIEVTSKLPIKNRIDLSLAYTPGVAEPCRRIAANPDEVNLYTSRGNMIAVLTDGSAVLGLGNIGPKAALPVMEGKAILFREFAGVDAFPILVDSQDTEEIIKTAALISPGFGGINLEDISAPRCFEIEGRLKEMLDIPVFHDDQHGTAVVILAGLRNALKIVKKEMKDLRILINGAGAAGVATAKLLMECGVTDIVVLDSKAALHYCRDDIQGNQTKKELAKATNIPCSEKNGLPRNLAECDRCLQGGLAESLLDRDVFIGVSKANLLTGAMVESMAPDPIIFALANPDPEILPDLAKEAGAAVVGTGRSDFPNQVNNVLGFPFIFRGALDANATEINESMKIAAAMALADAVENPTADKIIPEPFELPYREKVSKAVFEAAISSGVARLK